VLVHGLWRIRYNQELAEIYKDLDSIRGIEKERLEWVGPVVRKDHGRVFKKIFENKAEGKRRMGKPRLRWSEDIEIHLREMNVKRCRHKAIN
jgi:hypothetical protein